MIGVLCFFRVKCVYCLVWFVLYRKDLCTVSTTIHQDTMMDVIGQCGSYLCLAPLMHLKCWRSLKKLKLHTLMHSSESLDSTMFVKCNALVSLLTHQKPTKFDICTTLYYYFLCIIWPFVRTIFPTICFCYMNVSSFVFFFCLRIRISFGNYEWMRTIINKIYVVCF